MLPFTSFRVTASEATNFRLKTLATSWHWVK